MPNPIRLAVIDDHPLLRAGVVHVLDNDDGIEIVGQGASAEDAIRIVAHELPDLVLLDVSMPGGGIQAARQISERWPTVKCVMLTVSESHGDVAAALKAGARGYILKGISGAELCAAVKNVYNNASYISPSLAMDMLSKRQNTTETQDELVALVKNLSSREEQIFRLLAIGDSNKVIGDKLGIKESTVKHYMTNVMQKLQVRNRVEAALFAQRIKEEEREN
jgi:DNA-binding NarL/FixJ family response regulator